MSELGSKPPSAERDIIISCLKDVLRYSPPSEDFFNQDNFSIFGTHGLLDSMGLVNFVVLLEEEIDRRTQGKLSLSTDDLFGRDLEKFADVVSLENHLKDLFVEK